jgi:hypothetical protein
MVSLHGFVKSSLVGIPVVEVYDFAPFSNGILSHIQANGLVLFLMAMSNVVPLLTAAI